MSRWFVFALLPSFVLMAADATQALAEKKKVDILKTWSGSVDDENAMKPECITSAKGLDAVWKAWNIPGEMPKVDFTKQMVVAVYSVGSKLNIAGASLDDTGNLDVLGFGTRDIRPGFRYVLAIVSKDGVKTVNKKAIPPQ